MVAGKYFVVALLAMLFAVCERPPAQRNLPSSRPANAGAINSKAKSIIFASADAASAPSNLQFLDTATAIFRQIIETSLLAETRTQNPEVRVLAKRMIDDSRQFLDKISNVRGQEFPDRPPAINADLPAVRTLIEMLESGDIEQLKSVEFDKSFLRFSNLAAAAASAAGSIAETSESPSGSLATEVRDWAERRRDDAEKIAAAAINR
jgi:uncharacterized protein (DUF305 family)